MTFVDGENDVPFIDDRVWNCFEVFLYEISNRNKPIDLREFSPLEDVEVQDTLSKERRIKPHQVQQAASVFGLLDHESVLFPSPP